MDDYTVNGVRLYRDSAGNLYEYPINPTGSGGTPAVTMTDDRDTDGNPVPTYKAHAYTYYGAGQVHSDTVRDGTNTWVRTYQYENGQQVADSGWVKQ